MPVAVKDDTRIGALIASASRLNYRLIGRYLITAVAVEHENLAKSVSEQGFMRARQPAGVQLRVGCDGASEVEVVIRKPICCVGSRSLSVGECA